MSMLKSILEANGSLIESKDSKWDNAIATFQAGISDVGGVIADYDEKMYDEYFDARSKLKKIVQKFEKKYMK